MPDVPGRCFFAVGWPFSLSFWPGVAWLSSCCNPGVSCGILRCTASGLWWALGCCLRCCICLQACQNLRTLPILPRFWAPWGLCHRDPQGSTGNINLWFIEAMLSYQKVQVLVIAFYCFLACVCVCEFVTGYVFCIACQGQRAWKHCYRCKSCYLLNTLDVHGRLTTDCWCHTVCGHLASCNDVSPGLFLTTSHNVLTGLYDVIRLYGAHRRTEAIATLMSKTQRSEACEIVWVCDDTCIFLSKIMDQVGSTIVCLGWRVFSYDALTKSPEFDSNGDIKELRALKEEARPFSFSGSHMLQFKII